MSHHTIDLANVKAIVAEIVASHDVKSVAFVGCGASSSELYPGYYFLKDAARTLAVQQRYRSAQDFDLLRQSGVHHQGMVG